MGLFRIIGKVAKPHVDVSRWLDLSSVKNTTSSLIGYVKNLFIPQKAQRQESFQQATKRLKLDEKTLITRQREFYWLAYMYFFISIAVFCYALYLIFFSHAFLSGYISFVIGAIVLAHAFRKRLWYFQVKTKRLGYSFKEWYQADILGKIDEKVDT